MSGLKALTSLDGRYQKAVGELQDIFSEYGLMRSRIYVEIHPDVYGQIPAFDKYALKSLNAYKYSDDVDEKRYNLAVLFKSGLPLDVTLYKDNREMDVPENEPSSIGLEPYFKNTDKQNTRTKSLVAKAGTSVL